MQRGVEEVCWYLYGTMHVGSCGKRLNFCETQPDYFETQPDFYRAQPEKPGRKHMRTSHRKHFIRAKASQKGAAYAEQRLIGLIGAGPAVGVTHTAVTMAGYLTGICRRRCAVLEWNDHGTFERLEESCLGKKNSGCRGSFRILDVDYYRNAGTETLVLCKKLRYQEVIVDYGAAAGGNQEEFFRCDRQFLLAGLSEWQTGVFLETAGAWKRAGTGWETLAVFGSEETRKNMEKELGLSIRRVPVSVDAFTVTETVMDFYQQIL